MKRRRVDMPVLSIALLDVLSNALGAVLLVLIFVVTTSRAETRWYRQVYGLMQDKNRQLTDKLAGAEDDVEKLRKRAAGAEQLRDNQQKILDQVRRGADTLRRERDAGLKTTRNQVEKLKKTVLGLRGEMAGVIGLKGEMRGVVFVFDTSESMKTPRYAEYLDLLKGWVRNLAFEQFNVVRFDSTVKAWSPALKTGSEENRRAAAAFIDTFKPQGQTNTLAALQAALAMPDVDTLILLSDGEPYEFRDGRPVLDANGRPVFGEPAIRQAQQWLRANIHGVVINTVGMGDYLNAAYGRFLQELAHEHGGEFIGR